MFRKECKIFLLISHYLVTITNSDNMTMNFLGKETKHNEPLTYNHYDYTNVLLHTATSVMCEEFNSKKNLSFQLPKKRLLPCYSGNTTFPSLVSLI